MEIEKNVPIPPILPRYDFSKMEVGDSVFFEGAKSSGKEYTSARMHGLRKNKIFTARKVDDGLRIWRIA